MGELGPPPQKFGVEVQSHGDSPAQVFAAFFKPQTRDLCQTESSSRALETVGFHLKRLALLREAERVKGEALTRFFGYFFDACQKSNTSKAAAVWRPQQTDKSKFETH